MKTLHETTKNLLIDYLNENYTSLELDDLHHNIYNTSDFFIYYSEAKEALENYDVFDAIEFVKEYETENFGVVNTDLSNPCKIANMLLYILGETLIWDTIPSQNKTLSNHYFSKWISAINEYTFN